MQLPEPSRLFPMNTRAAIIRFWLVYWFWFLMLLPWMLLLQLADMIRNIAALAYTWNRTIPLGDTGVELVYLNSWRTALATIVFGERFLAVRCGDMLIDPGPISARGAMLRYLKRSAQPIRTVFITHWHEEHIGNAGEVANRCGATLVASEATLDAIRQPQPISAPRRALMGLPTAVDHVPMRRAGAFLDTSCGRWRIIASAGHCDGHLSLYNDERKLLIAGDSFLHAIFTAPNGDVRRNAWLATLTRYNAMDVRTIITGHGCAGTRDATIAPAWSAIERSDPNALLHDALQFLTWARRVIAAGEARGLKYSVIEACLFPWTRPWTRRNWFRDEAARLFSCGEFSRTHLVRTLATNPAHVGPRFPRCNRMIRCLQG